MSQTNYDANDILMGGSGSPAWKFEGPGTTREGVIASPPQAKQEREYDPSSPGGGALKVFPSGDPIMGVIVEVQTGERDSADDDGKRTFYVEGRYIKEAVRDAVRASGARGLEVGGHIKVTFTHRDNPNDFRSRKHWTVTYTPAGNAALMVESAPAAQAAPVAAAPTGAQFALFPAAVAAPPAVDPAALAAFQAWQASQQSA
jgi:hypothetical protein